METDRLHQFIVIAESGSFTKAAEILNRGHGGLSKSIKTLEDELGVALFRPKGRGVELTENGHHLLQKSKEILSALNELTISPKKELLPKGIKLTILMNEALALGCSFSMVNLFAGPLEILELDAGLIEEQIQSSPQYFGLTFTPYLSDHVEHLKICDCPMALFGAEEQWVQQSLDQIPFIAPSLQNNAIPSSPMGHKTRDGWPWNRPRQVVFRTNNLALALEAVYAKKGAIVIPVFLAEQLNTQTKRGKLFQIPIPKKFGALESRTIFLAKHRDTNENGEMKKLSKLVRQLVHS